MTDKEKLDNVKDELHLYGFTVQDEAKGTHIIRITPKGRLALFLLLFLDPLEAATSFQQLIRYLVESHKGIDLGPPQEPMDFKDGNKEADSD